MIGIVAEGPADIAVLRNILKGKLGVDRDQTCAIRPQLSEDATDLGARKGFRAQRPEEYSNWTLVLEECRVRARVADFLESPLDEDGFVVIHIDTAEAHLPGYDVARPDRGRDDYSDVLRARVVEKLTGLLGPDLAGRVRYAVAVEETDAWVLTLHDTQDGRDTGARLNPKKRLLHVMKRSASGSPKEYHAWSRDFRDAERLDACAARNRSLRLFLDTLAGEGAREPPAG